jgi:hypothetical protein
MNAAVSVWLFFRILRWAGWFAFLAVGGIYMSDPLAHLNSFGHLTPAMEFAMFGTGLAAMSFGLLEMMMRERAGLATPTIMQLIPPKSEGPKALVR